MATAMGRRRGWSKYGRVERAKIRMALKEGMARKDIKRIFGPHPETIYRIENNSTGDKLSWDADYISGVRTVTDEANGDTSYGGRSASEEEDEFEDETVVEDDDEYIPPRRGRPPGRGRYNPYSVARAPGRPRKSGPREYTRGDSAVRGQKSQGRHGPLPASDNEAIARAIHPASEMDKVRDDGPIDPVISTDSTDPVRKFLQEMRLESDVRVKGLKAVGIDSAEKIDQLRSIGREALDAMFTQKSQIGTTLLASGFSQFELGILCFKLAGTA